MRSSANAHALARYAALCQEQDIVPIVEPEVLMDGDHTLERCEEVTDAVLAEVFRELRFTRVHLEGHDPQAQHGDLRQEVPATRQRRAGRRGDRALPEAPRAGRGAGIAFLSGGQSPAEATLHLSLMNALGPLPWQLTFSYGRALQDAALKAWGGKPAQFAAGQTRVRQVGAAQRPGAQRRAIKPGMEAQAA